MNQDEIRKCIQEISTILTDAKNKASGAESGGPSACDLALIEKAAACAVVDVLCGPQ